MSGEIKFSMSCPRPKGAASLPKGAALQYMLLFLDEFCEAVGYDPANRCRLIKEYSRIRFSMKNRRETPINNVKAGFKYVKTYAHGIGIYWGF